MPSRNVSGEGSGERPRGQTGRRGALARGWLILISAFVVLTALLSGPPTAARNAKEDAPDFPGLFEEVARYLKLYYLDLDRINARPLVEKAFLAIENVADEIFVENAEPGSPRIAVHANSKVQVFNLSSVENLDDAVSMLENVFQFLKRNYQGEMPLNEVRYAAMNGFLGGIDPHTLVFSPEAFEDFSVHIEGEISGVGMYVGTRDGKLTVIEVLKGATQPTPAFKAGFKKGDIITKIDDESTINMTVTEAVEKIRGPRYSKVALTIKRPSADDPEKLDTHVIDVQRDRVEIKSVESKLIPDWNKDGTGPWKGGVGYVKVINFDKNTTDSLKRHLDHLREENGKPLAGLIFDLRDNSGGLLTQAVEMSDLFLDAGSIVITATRGPGRAEKLQFQDARKDGSEPGYPIVVLANETSASGAEIVIGALQKNNRAIVLGTRTFGKGSVQQLHRLSNGAQLKITVSEYLIPGKISIQENGVVPDVQAKQVVLGDSGYDLFANERSATERNYEAHIVSRFAKKEAPSYTVDYLFDPPKDDPYSDRFMSGELEPAKDKLVQMGLRLLALGGSPFSPRDILQEKKPEIESLKRELFQEIVAALAEKGIDWSAGEAPAAPEEPAGKLELSLSSEIVQEPSGDKEDPIPVNKLVVTAKLANKGERTLHRLKGLSRSEYYLYKEQEFLFGKVAPGEMVSRSVSVRLPYFPHARNDLFTVDVSSTTAPPAQDGPPADKVLLTGSLQVELKDAGRPAFSYAADLIDAKSKEPLTALGPGDEAILKVKVKNIGSATAHKGITILRNETEPRRQVFLQKGRIEYAELKPQTETEVEFHFDVREGEPVDRYDFELAIADSYSGATLARKLTIARRGKEDASPFPNGTQFSPPVITATVLDPETDKPVILTGKDRLRLQAVIRSPDTDVFKAWVFNSALGEHELPPDKIFYVDSRGEPQLKIETSVALKKGVNLFTVVSNDRTGLESRYNIVVRRE
jgi:carboxyl-terminal processing protease